MTDAPWEMYAQQVQSSGASDLPRRLPSDVQALLESLDLDVLDPSAYTELGFHDMAQMLTISELQDYLMAEYLEFTDIKD